VSGIQIIYLPKTFSFEELISSACLGI